MARVSTYLNFMGTTEEAFLFYRSVFGTDFLAPILRFGDAPGEMALSEKEKNMVMHAELAILGGHVLMATDMLESQGHSLRTGNNMTINLELEDRAETERLFGNSPRVGPTCSDCRTCRGARTGAPVPTATGSAGCSTVPIRHPRRAEPPGRRRQRQGARPPDRLTLNLTPLMSAALSSAQNWDWDSEYSALPIHFPSLS